MNESPYRIRPEPEDVAMWWRATVERIMRSWWWVCFWAAVLLWFGATAYQICVATYRVQVETTARRQQLNADCIESVEDAYSFWGNVHCSEGAHIEPLPNNAGRFVVCRCPVAEHKP